MLEASRPNEIDLKIDTFNRWMYDFTWTFDGSNGSDVHVHVHGKDISK